MPLVQQPRALHQILKARQLDSGLWGEQKQQGIIEATSLALLALRQDAGFQVHQSARALQNARNQDGSWPAFTGDSAGCWVTALAVHALLTLGTTEDMTLAIKWIVEEKGGEANWFWRWKFQTVDNSVKFDPAKYGWNWIPGTTSWVIPTAFSLIALQKARAAGLSLEPRLNARVSTGVSMLLDRMCPGGGWNAGNSVAFGVAYAPYIDATSIALLALRRYEHEPGVRASLSWLATRLPDCPSPYSLAWGLLAITAYRRKNKTMDTAGRAFEALLIALGNSAAILDTSTIATCALALEAIDGENAFEV